MAAVDRRHGYKGKVEMDPTGNVTTPVYEPVASLNSWTANFERELVPVPAFGDTVRVNLQGLPNATGTIGGWWEAAETKKLFDVMLGDIAVMLKLTPSTLDATYFFSGLAYLSGSVEVNADGAITMSGTWAAADAWTFDSTP